MEEKPDDARAIINKVVLALKARKAAKAAKDSVLRKGALEGMTLPGKLADCQTKSAEEAELFVQEILKYIWIDMFMYETRKRWATQAGKGSQSQERTPYIILAKSMLNVLEAERKQWNEECAEDENDEDYEKETIL